MRLWAALVGIVCALICAASAHAKVVWLCHPGDSGDPCEQPLDTTALHTSGAPTVSTPAKLAEDRRALDCFYVYPTVSNQPTPTANQNPDPELKAVTKFQVSRFSPLCRMFAPVYRQATLAGVLANVLPTTAEVAYSDVKEAWEDYLAHDNGGRGVILLGHSQGTIMLRALIRREIDPNPDQRKLLVGGVLLGGNVTTKAGQTTGGDFANVPICSKPAQDGCVVAYSTYSTDPVAASFFGNTNTDALAVPFNTPSGNGYQVACTDPATLIGSNDPVPLTIPTEPFTPGAINAGISVTAGGALPTAASTWVATADTYTGSCQTISGAHVYRYFPVGASRKLNEFPPAWGTHLVDFNLGQDRLVSIAAAQDHTYLDGAFTAKLAKTDRKRGTATLSLAVPGAGTVAVKGSGLRRATKTIAAPAGSTLSVRPSKLLTRKLRRRHKAKVTATVTYTPGGAPAITRKVKLTLRRR